MAKVFTITDGLENLGPLKSGGQGSVYKARRSGEIITAIKILPTPIASETDDDKNFTSFQNEVQKLKRVNELHNPNVVSITSWGITNSGNLPYIEMEYIEGPDLGELLKPPYDPVFTIKETIKVADHISNALAHCHQAEVKHGDIKSNNIKFNRRTGNYMLLDFGLSVMSDEQRRTSIRYAGAIEFMAPEQSAGETLFETDIYSFGIILFELLSGTVPFPLLNKGEMARNAVMVAHLESPLPDLLSHRRLALPVSWSNEKKERELKVPAWLVEMICTCLEKDPAKRFRNGAALQEFIHNAVVAEENRTLPGITLPQPVAGGDPSQEKQIKELREEAVKKEHLINNLKYEIETKDRELYQLNLERYSRPKRSGISKAAFFPVLFIALALGAYATYHSVIKPSGEKAVKTPASAKNIISNAADSSYTTKARTKKKVKTKPKIKTPVPAAKDKPVTFEKPLTDDIHVAAEKNNLAKKPVTNQKPKLKRDSGLSSNVERDLGIKYKVNHSAYFYEEPDVNARNNFYITGTDVPLVALHEKNDFVYVKFLNSYGKVIRTWLAKKDLKVLYE